MDDGDDAVGWRTREKGWVAVVTRAGAVGRGQGPVLDPFDLRPRSEVDGSHGGCLALICLWRTVSPVLCGGVGAAAGQSSRAL